MSDWNAAIEAAARHAEAQADAFRAEADRLHGTSAGYKHNLAVAGYFDKHAAALRALRRPEAEPEAGVIRDDAARWAADLAVSAVARGRRHAADGLPLHAAAELEEAAAHAKAAAERLRAIAARAAIAAYERSKALDELMASDADLI